MADKIKQIIPSTGLRLIYLAPGVSFDNIKSYNCNTAFTFAPCVALALVERGSEQKIVGLDIDLETGSMVIPDADSGFVGLSQHSEDEAFYYQLLCKRAGK